MSTTYSEIVLVLENQVTHTDKTIPLTGVYSLEQEIDGWKYNRRIMPDYNSDNSRYLTHIGGHEVGLQDGTAITHWQSGVIDGIEYKDIAHMRVGNDLTWTPRYTTGSFSVYWDDRRLFSDYSFSENAIDLTGGRTTLDLRSDAVYNSINAAIYKRLSDFQIVSIREADLVSAFTGIISSGARLELAEGVPSDWSEVETRKYEMLVESDVLYFNQDFGLQVGGSYVASADLTQTWENGGQGLATGRPIFLEYFPVDPDSVELVSVDSLGTITTWTKVDDLNLSTSTDQHFSVNRDLGVITTGGYQAPDLTLSAPILASSTEIHFVVSDAIESYPEYGVIQIGSEYIKYESKTETSFKDCTRGYFGSTTPPFHLVGALISDIQHGAASTDTWYVKYKAVPRVDYEVSSYDTRTANYSSWLDVRAIKNVKANNIVQLVSQDTNLSSIVLTTDALKIGGSLYGPIYYGTDTAKVTAIGYDAAGNPVEDIDLTIEIESGPGALNGTLSSYTAESNTKGEVNAFFSAPYDNDDAIQEVVSVTHVGADTHMELNATNAIAPNEAWVFQILKHDPVLGTVGNKVSVTGGDLAAGPGTAGYVDVYMVYTEDYDGGTIIIENSGTSVRVTDTIVHSERLVDGFGISYVRFYLENGQASTWFTGADDAWLLQEEAVTWDPILKRGARVILYEWDVAAIHPITSAAGAYMPVRPDAVQGSTLIFTGRHLPIPAPTDDSNNLGAYVVVAPSETAISAYGRDPFSGRLIRSNQIRLRVQVPSTLTGVDTSGGLPIPYGWTLITEEFNIGAGLDGANFITINPAASGINQFNITGVF